jgi:tripartite-type tricarboxylate transporter receptor subunit TctC
MHMIARRLTAFAAATTMAIASTAPSLADPDFSGQRIEMIISSAEGGGADTYARFVGAALEKELPGKPTILARNMTGGGGMISANWFEAHARPDGLIIYSSAPSTKLTPVFNPDQVQFDSTKWIPIVTSPNGYIVEGSNAAGTMTVEDLLAAGGKPQPIGLASVLGASTLVLLSLDMLGVNVKPAFNVPGGDAQLSFERGEFSLNSDSMGSYFRLNGKNVEDGKVAPLYVFGNRVPGGGIERDSSLPDVPTFVEVYEKVHGKKPEGIQWEAFKAIFDVVSVNSKTFMLPAGTPDDIVKVYREAAERAMTNPEFMASEQYANILGTAPQLFGDEAKAAFDEALVGLTPEVVDYLRKWHKEKFDVNI